MSSYSVSIGSVFDNVDQDEEKSEEWDWTRHKSPSISHPFEEFLNDPSGTMRTTFYESSKTNLTTTRLTTDFVSSPEVDQCGDKPGSKDKSVSDDSNWSLSTLCSNHSVSIKVNLELPCGSTPTSADSSVDSVLSPKIKLHSTDQSLPPQIDQTSDEPEVEEEEYPIPDDPWFDYLESIDKLVKRKNGVYFKVKWKTGLVTSIPSQCMGISGTKRMVDKFLVQTYSHTARSKLKGEAWYRKIDQLSRTSESEAFKKAKKDKDFIEDERDDKVVHWYIQHIQDSINLGSEVLFVIKWTTGELTIEPSVCLASARNSVDQHLVNKYKAKEVDTMKQSIWYKRLVYYSKC